MPFYTEHSGDSFTLPRVDLNPLQDKVPQAESPFVQVWTPCSLSYLPSVWRTHRTRYVHPRWYTVVDAGGTGKFSGCPWPPGHIDSGNFSINYLGAELDYRLF